MTEEREGEQPCRVEPVRDCGLPHERHRQEEHERNRDKPQQKTFGAAGARSSRGVRQSDDERHAHPWRKQRDLRTESPAERREGVHAQGCAGRRAAGLEGERYPVILIIPD